MSRDNDAILGVMQRRGAQVVSEWLQQGALAGDRDASSQQDAARLVAGVEAGLRAGGPPDDLDAAAWKTLREALDALSQDRAARGRSAGETSRFVLAFKRPFFGALQADVGSDPALLVSALGAVSTLGDQMAQWTVTAHQRTREEIIQRQQRELLELSTPVIKLWQGVLAVPMIGTLDSSRTQTVMETLLQEIARGEARLAIIDITGVPTVDTLVAQHLLQTVAAIRLMGADCIISGIRPQIAQTMVHLGIAMQGVATRSTLADALELAFERSGLEVVPAAPRPRP
jgi:rsbT co-antagonist protein RsbR